MITFKYDQEQGILEVKYSGQITIEELNNYGEQIYKDKSLPRRLKILTDVSDGYYNINPSEFPELNKNLEIHLSVYEHIKAAFVHSKPRETAYALIISQENSIANYERKVFSTMSAARRWLLS